MLQSLKKTWFSNVRGDVLAGLVVALALIPEAIAFSIIAAGVVIAIPVLIVFTRRRRADRLRRRGVKSYNRTAGTAPAAAPSNRQ